MARHPKVDVVGSFGSRFSYATHSVELARALKSAGLLGRCLNLDDEALEDYAHLSPHLYFPAWEQGEGRQTDAYQAHHGAAAIVIAAPTEAVRALASAYDVAALFVCPNTNELSREALETCKAFDRLIVPSRYCQRTVTNAHAFDHVARLGLGVHDVFFEGRRSVRERQRRREARNEPLRIAHFTSDWYWPGRKGTQELIEAWPTIRADAARPVELVIHAVEVMRDAIYYHCADQGLLDPEVRVASSGALRGSLPHELFEAMADVDLVLQPSRAEGYGMVALAAMVAGVPLVTTYETGEYDFLEDFGAEHDGHPAWEGVWTDGLLCPEPEFVGPLHGEEGIAPLVNPCVIADATLRALRHLPQMRRAASTLQNTAVAFDARWERRMEPWKMYATGLIADVVSLKEAAS